MSLSPFSFLMALLWSSLFIGLFHLCRRINVFITRIGVISLFLLIMISTARMIVTLELPFVTILRSPFLLTKVQDFLNNDFILDLSVVHFLLGIWVVVSALLLFQFLNEVRNYNNLIKLVRYRRDVKSEKVLESIKGDSKCKRTPFVVRCSRGITPFIAGFPKQMIYLPDVEYSDEDLYNVLLHEWVHFLHRDAWIKFSVQLFCIAFWWNPLVYLLKKDVGQILELNCDKCAMDHLKARGDSDALESYTGTIIRTIEQQSMQDENKKKVSSTPMLNGFVYTEADANFDIIQRFEILKESEKVKVSKSLMVAFAIVVLSLFAFSFTFVIQPENPAPVVEGMLDTESIYLLFNENGNYDLYINGVFEDSITPEKAKSFIESGVPIKGEDNEI